MLQLFQISNKVRRKLVLVFEIQREMKFLKREEVRGIPLQSSLFSKVKGHKAKCVGN